MRTCIVWDSEFGSWNLDFCFLFCDTTVQAQVQVQVQGAGVLLLLLYCYYYFYYINYYFFHVFPCCMDVSTYYSMGFRSLELFLCCMVSLGLEVLVHMCLCVCVNIQSWNHFQIYSTQALLKPVLFHIAR